jgi:HK97 family phage major capsid protein
MQKSADDLRRERKAAADAMNVAATALADAADDEAGAKAQAAFDKAKADFDKLDAQVKALEAAEAAQAAAAVPAATLPGTPAAGAVPAQVAEKGLRFAAMTRALAAAGGIPYVAAQIAEGMGHSGLFANQNMGSGAAGGFLVPEDVSAEIIELLRPASVVMSLNPVTVPMPNANLTMNRQATGAAASYIGEQQDVPATAIGFGQVKLSAKKLAALIPISNDLLRAAGVAVDRLVRDDILASVGQKTDAAFIRAAGSDYAPRGLRYQLIGTALAATNILTMTATPDLVKITTDLARLELALLNADVPMLRPGWMMAPRVAVYLSNLRDGNGNIAFPEMAGGTLRGKPYRTTTQIPTNLGGGTESEVYLADFAQVVVGEHMGMEIAMSTDAAYKDAAGNLQASFSRDETVMRAIVQHDIGMRHLAALAVLTGVTWGA